MTYVIAAPCIDVMDQSCVAVCPVDCIHSEPGADRKFYIDPNECIGCGSCEQECAQHAIFAADALPEGWEGFAWVDATWYQDRAAARSVIEEATAA